MTRDDIIRMAHEAEMIIDHESNPWGPVITATCADLERFAKLVAAKDTELLQQMLWLCSKDGGWTLEEAANTICEIENILLARLEGK
jgi:hypothetical protein